MNKFPALAAMGIRNPEQIARYALFMYNNTDILRIVYARQKGSILPVSKKFKFPRIKKTALVDSGTRQTEMVYNSSQEFINALAELDHLMDDKDSAQESKKLLTEEVRLLEEDITVRIDYIKSLVEKI